VRRASGDLRLYRRLLRQARPYWLHLAGILAVSLLAPPLALLTPVPLRIAVDSVIGSHPLPGVLVAWVPGAAHSATEALLLAAALTVGVALLVHLQALASWLLQTYTGERLVLDFRGQLFAHVQRLSLSYHDTRGTTDSTYRIQYDAPSVQWILVNGVTAFVTSGFTLVGMIYVVARIDWIIALIALGAAPALFVFIRLSRQRLRNRWYEVKEHQSSAMSVVQEALAAARVVKAFGQEAREQQRFIHHASRGMRGQIQLAFIEGGFDLLVGLTIGVATAATLLVGVSHVRTGALTLGQLLMVMAYLAQLYSPLQAITKAVAELQGSLAGAERAFALLDQVPDVAEHREARAIARAAGAVTFRDVSFAYDPDHPILRHISFEVGAGARVGIMGATGAGKTTLVSLLTRFYDPTVGQILLDGVDLREYRLDDLRNQFALVLQEPVLFSTSIAENIAYARPDAGEREIIAAARQANAHEFITRLPQGYDTQVGERGLRLSGGERQRVSLARAFLKDAPILILDEPTSAVDVRTEAGILDAMERLMRGRTTFLIAHRRSTLTHCEAMLVMEGGRLAAFGACVPAPGGDALPTVGSDLTVGSEVAGRRSRGDD
jgi:ATP-binding cassette, subfamily B, bacterial